MSPPHPLFEAEEAGVEFAVCLKVSSVHLPWRLQLSTNCNAQSPSLLCIAGAALTNTLKFSGHERQASTAQTFSMFATGRRLSSGGCGSTDDLLHWVPCFPAPVSWLISSLIAFRVSSCFMVRDTKSLSISESNHHLWLRNYSKGLTGKVSSMENIKREQFRPRQRPPNRKLKAISHILSHTPTVLVQFKHKNAVKTCLSSCYKHACTQNLSGTPEFMGNSTSKL